MAKERFGKFAKFCKSFEILCQQAVQNWKHLWCVKTKVCRNVRSAHKLLQQMTTMISVMDWHLLTNDCNDEPDQAKILCIAKGKPVANVGSILIVRKLLREKKVTMREIDHTRENVTKKKCG